MIWNNLSNLLADEFERLEDKSLFLQERHARITYGGEGSRMLVKAKRDPNYETLKDRHLNGQKHYAGYSQGTLRAILYIREMHEYFDPADIDFMTDFGPGYGNFTRCWHDLYGLYNPKLHFQLVDLPRLHQISEYYLGLHNITVNHKTLDDMINPHGKSLFFAAHSLNEMVLKERTRVEERLAEYDYLFLVYNQTFEGIDNVVWFDGLAKRLEKDFLTYTYQEETSGKWRLVGVKK